MQFENEISMREYVKIVSDMLTFSMTLAISLSLWIFSMAVSAYSGDLQPVSPWRWLLSILTPLSLTSRARKCGSLDHGGALGGLVVGFILMMANKSFFSSMLAFFITFSTLTTWKEVRRHHEGGVEDAGPQKMGLVQVLLNGGVPTQLALLYMVEAGPREAALDFQNQYGATWLCLSLLGALACRTGDAWASKLGPVLSKGRPKLITSWREVPAGTNGGVTPQGLVASFAGGVTVGWAYFVTQVLFVTDVHLAAPQWPVIIYGGMAGLLGSMLDSFLGAEMQYSGYDESTGEVVNFESRRTKRICGKPVLDNNTVNLFSSIIIALAMPEIAWGFWPRL
ncbi:transmembrane protein 19-like [Arapaima gigas]